MKLCVIASRAAHARELALERPAEDPHSTARSSGRRRRLERRADLRLQARLLVQADLEVGEHEQLRAALGIRLGLRLRASG